MESTETVNKKICVACDSETTLINNGYQQWRYHDGHRYCNNCYTKYVRDTRDKNRKQYLKRGKNRFIFRRKSIELKYNPRKGICSWCGKTGLTHLHHKEYHEEDPLKDTIELCVSCHFKESWKLGTMKPNPYRDSKTGRFSSLGN